MGNTYQVVEKGIIKCMCGGMVELESSNENFLIGDDKPLYWDDLLGADIKGCPSNTPCTKVVLIASLGTEKNVSDSNGSFLLTTDGFQSDQGKPILLDDPGQSSTSILTKSSGEEVSLQKEEEKEKEEKEKEKEEKEDLCTYKIKLLRKSQNIYKPLRPIRNFKKFEELTITDKKNVYSSNNVYNYYLSYLYIYDGTTYKEIEISSEGTLYAETLEQVFFKYEGERLNYIPLKEDKKITIYYSNIKLSNPGKESLEGLHNIIIDPKNLDGESSFFISKKHDLNKSIILEDDLKFIKQKKKSEESGENFILGIFDDILGEIEDLYHDYLSHFKKAYRINYDDINEIKEINAYAFTISNIINNFYVDEDTYKAFNNLNETFKNIVNIFLSDKIYIEEFFAKENGDISWIFNKDQNNAGLAYLNMVKNKYHLFFEEFSYLDKLPNKLSYPSGAGNTYYLANKDSFKTQCYSFGYSVKYNKYEIKHDESSKNRIIHFNPKNKDYESILKNANEFLATIIFCVIFSSNEEFEKILKGSQAASKINAYRLEFDKILKTIRPITFINKYQDKDIKDFIEKNTIYSDILNKDSKKSSDSYLSDYENLDLLNTKQSFAQDGKTFNSFIKSKYLYFFEDSKFYRETNKDKNIIPKEIIQIIHSKLKSEDLKNILKAYQDIKDTNLQNYILFSRNTIYMLCAPRLNIDEESIFNNIFHKDLSHIYDFYSFLIEKMRLEDKDNYEMVADLIQKYQISTLFLNMISKSYIFAILQAKDSDFHKNAKKFIPYDDIKDDTKEDKHRFLIAKEPKFTKQILEKIKYAECISKGVEDILNLYMQNKESDKYNTVNQYLKSLKSFSATIAFLRIIDFTLSNDRSLKDFSQFASDSMTLTIYITNFLKQKNVLSNSTLINFAKQLQKDNKILFVNLSIINRINIILVIISSINDSTELNENRDYDALVLNNISLAFVIAIACVPMAFPTFLIISVVDIIFCLILYNIKGSELLIFLKRTIFAKDLSTKNILFNDNKIYNPYYLKESFKNNKDIGFSSPKELIDFIGKNYYTYKNNFEIAFKNEIQFLHTNLLDLKLKKVKYMSEEEYIINNRKIIFKVKEAILIPSVLLEDKEFELIVDTKKYGIKLEDGIFDIFLKNSELINELLNKNENKYKAKISIKTPLGEFAYEITYNIKKNLPNSRGGILNIYNNADYDVNVNDIEQILFDN